MKEAGLLYYKDALKDKAFKIDPNNIVRIPAKDQISNDYDVNTFEGIVNPFIIDQIKISNSKAYRREASKTQVFYSPDNPHIRMRMSHTDEVESSSVIVSDILGLNTELVRAIAKGHDLGHGPTGHLFEEMSKEFGTEFKHEIFSAIIAVFIERSGGGLNLTRETIGGILNHSQDRAGLGFNIPPLQEHEVVMFNDKIAYLFSDPNDLQRVGMLTREDLKAINSLFSSYQRHNVGECISALVLESAEAGKVSFETSETAQRFKQMKKMMYQHYSKIDHTTLKEILRVSIDKVSKIPELVNYDPILITALMTDKELKNVSDKIILSKRITLDDLKDFGVYEVIKNGCLEGTNYSKLETELRHKLVC